MCCFHWALPCQRICLLFGLYQQFVLWDRELFDNVSSVITIRARENAVFSLTKAGNNKPWNYDAVSWSLMSIFHKYVYFLLLAIHQEAALSRHSQKNHCECEKGGSLQWSRYFCAISRQEKWHLTLGRPLYMTWH